MGILLRHPWEAILCVLSLVAWPAIGQFSHKKPWPTYSLQNMPQTAFTCHDKILGGYYADPETQCQMFHVCVKVAGVGVQDFRFLCPNATAFDQEAQICADWGDVDCEQAVLYYGSDNFDLYRIGSSFESKRAPLAEEEEATFHLQRAESADIRRSKETRVDQKFRPDSQTYSRKFESTSRNPFFEGNSDSKRNNYDQNNDFNRVTQRFDAPKKSTSSYYTTPKGNDIQGDSKQESDDLFKGSHSSNFFSNRNGGREDDYYESKPTATSTTTTTPKPYNQQAQYFNGNAPQNDFKDFNKISETSTKRPQRGRRPTPPQTFVSNPTIRSSPPSTTINTLLPDVPKTTKKVTLQTSFNFANEQFYKSPSTSTSYTTTTTTLRPSIATQKYPFNDFQQNIQPTTYSPSSAFRFKPTTNKYDDINETALRGEKPGPNAFVNSQYDNQELEVFSRVSNRKSSNAERNPQKQSTKNTTPANRNEFTDFTKTKTPTGFQAPARVQQVQPNAPQTSVNSGLNVQPLDPSKLNSELRGINQTQPSQRERTSNRFNARQQTEPLFYRSKTQDTPAPFTSPQAQQQQQPQRPFDSTSKASHQRDYSRVRSGPTGETGANLEQTPADSGFNNQRDVSRSRYDQRNDYASLQRNVSKSRSEQRTESVASQQSNLNGYNAPQRDSSRFRSQSRTGTTKLESTSSTSSYSEPPPPTRSRGRINYKATTQHQGRSLDNFEQSTTSGTKKFSTLVPKDQYYPTTFKPTTYKKAFDIKPTKHAEPKTRGTTFTTPTKSPIPNTTSRLSSSTPDEHDGQYHPELYEVDYSWNSVSPGKKSPPSPTRPQTTSSPQGHLQSQQQTAFQKQAQQQPLNNFQQQPSKPSQATATDLSDEEELFKTAHSLNLGAASLNKLRADTLKTADKSPPNSSPNFSFDRSTYPTQATSTPFTSTTPSTTWRPITNFITTTTTSTFRPSPYLPSKKPKKSSASKRPPHADEDTSYDYAYYDSLSETPQEYPEYDVISEFRKTKKH